MFPIRVKGAADGGALGGERPAPKRQVFRKFRTCVLPTQRHAEWRNAVAVSAASREDKQNAHRIRCKPKPAAHTDSSTTQLPPDKDRRKRDALMR